MNNKRKITIIAIVPRAAARMFSSIPRYGDISDHMQDILHWLPVRKRILYIRSLQLAACSGRQTLCSASRGDFVVPHAHMAIKQHRAFSFWTVGPSAWNRFPSELCSLPRDLSSSSNQLLSFCPGLRWERI